jgi:uncharacterized protein (TIGR02217 family)
MTAFIESPRFPEEVSAWARGGPEFQTAIAMAGGGAEMRNSIWTYPLCKWDIGGGLRTIANAQATIAFHRNAAGRANGFRMLDPFDNSATVSTGVQGTSGLGTGLPTSQLYKNYTIGGSTAARKISKPVVGTVSLQRAVAAMTAGSAPGNYALDTTTGIITYVADSSAAVTGVTVGATTQVTLASALSGLAVGGALYLSGLTGADAAALNGAAPAITNIAGAVYTLAVNTTGLTITAAGNGYKYPQPTESMTWAGSFDVPVRFDNDWLQLSLDEGGLLSYDAVILKELRL